jgi:hypothetical protein
MGTIWDLIQVPQIAMKILIGNIERQDQSGGTTSLEMFKHTKLSRDNH